MSENKIYDTPTALLLDINKGLEAENQKLRDALKDIKAMLEDDDFDGIITYNIILKALEGE